MTFGTDWKTTTYTNGNKYFHKVYCTAICANFSCEKMLTKSVAERTQQGGEWIRRSNLSLECVDYIEVLSLTEMEDSL